MLLSQAVGVISEQSILQEGETEKDGVSVTKQQKARLKWEQGWKRRRVRCTRILEEQTLVSEQHKHVLELKYLQKRISWLGLLSELSDRTSAVGLLCDGVCGERTGGTFHTLGAAWWGGGQTEVTWLLLRSCYGQALVIKAG